jgi:hypothetical protein
MCARLCALLFSFEFVCELGLASTIVFVGMSLAGKRNSAAHDLSLEFA